MLIHTEKMHFPWIDFSTAKILHWNHQQTKDYENNAHFSLGLAFPAIMLILILINEIFVKYLFMEVLYLGGDLLFCWKRSRWQRWRASPATPPPLSPGAPGDNHNGDADVGGDVDRGGSKNQKWFSCNCIVQVDKIIFEGYYVPQKGKIVKIKKSYP